MSTGRAPMNILYRDPRNGREIGVSNKLKSVDWYIPGAVDVESYHYCIWATVGDTVSILVISGCKLQDRKAQWM